MDTGGRRGGTLECRWRQVLGCDVKSTRGPVGHSLGVCSVDEMQVEAVTRIMDGESSALWSHWDAKWNGRK